VGILGFWKVGLDFQGNVVYSSYNSSEVAPSLDIAIESSSVLTWHRNVTIKLAVLQLLVTVVWWCASCTCDVPPSSVLVLRSTTVVLVMLSVLVMLVQC